MIVCSSTKVADGGTTAQLHFCNMERNIPKCHDSREGLCTLWSPLALRKYTSVYVSLLSDMVLSACEMEKTYTRNKIYFLNHHQNLEEITAHDNFTLF